ncbi:ABC transporter substrate-binding protein [Geotoga petraea]|jgi:NitT/TauT family transport system substrate-binding protein|uniref:ABC transporter substrate-binding protein n=1 Tax=Geotoga petraea TaxID=28234 RepID=A0A1G6M3E0_9BACT|nr:MqnA/MqnD/SBP family protein [Geotoga petraea]MDK2945885.1 NitT/TauT family transport system substrate-binding protein [Geotoga sp.]TGG87534.1 ABC transporter substrate-binding protein [Geotoga petraea]SDC49476.1 NitT/TauT family transport system substrate-binding protein [Geotoga petraea]
MKKKLLLFILSVLFISAFALNFYNPLGPSLLPAAGLYIEPIEGLETKFWRSLDEAQTLVIKEQADFIVLPVAFGVQLMNRDVNYKLAGVSLWKTFSLISSKDVKSIEDLEGKTIYTIQGPGQTADLVLKILKEERNLDVNIHYITNGADIIQLLASGKADYAVLPEPFASLAEVKTQGNVKVVMDIEQLYSQLTNLQPIIPITGLFVRGDIEHNEAKKVIDAYSNSANLFFNNYNNEAIEYVVETMGGKMPKPVMQKAAERSIIKYDVDKETINSFLEVIKNYGIIDKIPENLYY